MSLIQTIIDDPKAFINRLKEEHGLSEDEVAQCYRYARPSIDTFDGQAITLWLAHHVGGGEGEGEYVERVLGIKVDDKEVFLRTTGFYSSYEGTDWSGEWEHVEPREVTVVRYFPVGT